MQFAVVSLFPEMFAAVSDHGVTGRAIKQGLVGLSHCNPRDFTSDRHRTVDDRPYGGGPGMLMKIDPLQQAIAAARGRSRPGREWFTCRPRAGGWITPKWWILPGQPPWC